MRFVLSLLLEARPGAPRVVVTEAPPFRNSLPSSSSQSCCTPFYHPQAESVAFPGNDGGTKAADGVGEIDGVGLAEVFECEDLLVCVGVGFEDVAAVDAGEQPAFDGRREEAAGFLDEDVVDGGFGDFAAVVQEEDFV